MIQAILGGGRGPAAESRDGCPRPSGAASESVRFAEAHVPSKCETPRAQGRGLKACAGAFVDRRAKPGREHRSILDPLAGVSGRVEASEGLADIPRGSAGVGAGVPGGLGLGMALDKDAAQVAGMALDKDTAKALGRASSESLCGHAPVWAWEMMVSAPDAVRARRRFDSWPVAT